MFLLAPVPRVRCLLPPASDGRLSPFFDGRVLPAQTGLELVNGGKQWRIPWQCQGRLFYKDKKRDRQTQPQNITTPNTRKVNCCVLQGSILKHQAATIGDKKSWNFEINKALVSYQNYFIGHSVSNCTCSIVRRFGCQHLKWKELLLTNSMRKR